MRGVLVVLLGILFGSGIFSLSAAPDPPSSLYKMIDTGKEEIYHFRLDSALSLYRQVQQKYPDYPHGYFYEAYITTIYFSQDETNDSLDAALHRVVRQAIRVGEDFKDRQPDSPDALYYLGVSYGVLGIYHVLNRSYLKGYYYGRKGKNYLEEVVATDSAYYDAYLGLGIFHYYVDMLPGVIKIIARVLGFQGDRRRGIREIRLTSRKGRFFRVEGEFAYAVIRYFLEGRIWEGMKIFTRLQNRYPDNPALTLLLGYHYRRMGSVQKAIRYFSSVPDSYRDALPQITVIKYYNIGVCHFYLNELPQAEAIFDRLIRMPVRKSDYYNAALAYYKGLLADLRFDRRAAERYFRMIVNQKDTHYWYNISRMYADLPMDSLLYYYVLTENDIFTANFDSAEVKMRRLYRLLRENNLPNDRSFIKYLIDDLHARLKFRERKVKEAMQIYRTFISRVDDVPDKFQRAWIYLNYARVLREAKEREEAMKMLEKARVTDDEYTRIIIEREMFILRNMKEKT